MVHNRPLGKQSDRPSNGNTGGARTGGTRTGAPEEMAGSFGFAAVSPDEKTGRVRQVFDAVAPSYDRMNDLMSGGIHRLWKRQLVAMIRPREGMQVLDVAGGTGDIAFRVVRAGADAIVCDINAAMLGVGRDRMLDQGHGASQARLAWVCGNAEALPLPDRTMDAYVIAFGLRNVTYIDKALAEARRVLKPGGRFFCLEFSRVANPLMARAYDAYSFNVIPRLGGLVARDRDAYAYLVESIRRFPDQPALVEAMEAAGLSRCSYRNLSGGIAAIHSGWRL